MSHKDLSIADFKKKIDANEPLLVLDVRKEEDFVRQHLEGDSHFTLYHASYPLMVEQNPGLEPVEAARRSLEEHWKNELPKNQPIHVICARGRSSLIVVKALEELGYEPINIVGGMQAWSNLFQQIEVHQSAEFKIIQIMRPARGCLSYLIAIKDQAILIDPARQLDVYQNLIQEMHLKPLFVLDTHAHADHISGGKALAQHYQVPYCLHPYDGIHPMDLLPAAFSYQFIEVWEKNIEGVSFKALHVPGHTLGNQAFLVGEKYLFGGDTIFLNSIARPDLGGHAESWAALHYASLRMLLDLDDEIVVLPGHFSKGDHLNGEGGYWATIGELKARNEGLKMAQRPYPEFKKYILEHLPNFPSEYIEIKRINLGLVEVGETEAAKLESGQNICSLS